MPRKRRPPGTGSVHYSKSKKAWLARFTPPGDKQIERRAPTQDEAHAILAQLRRAPTPGARQGSQTLATFLRAWLEEQVKPDRPRSYKNYRGHVEIRIIPAIGHVKLSAVSPQHVQALITALRTAEYAPSSIRVCRAVLSAALAVAEEWELIDRNPVRRVRAPRVRVEEPPALTAEQARELIALFQGTRLAGVVTIALLYGLRQSEIIGLRWSDVELSNGSANAVANGTITVSGQLDRLTGRWQAGTKTGDTRVLPLLGLAVRALSAQRQAQREARLRAGRLWTDSGHIFTREDGRPLSASGVAHSFALKLMRAGHPPLKFHHLRHGTASLLAALGVHQRISEIILGHESAATHRRYAHIPPALLRSELERLDRALGE